MKIRVPDEADTITVNDRTTEPESPVKKVGKTFEEEIQEILQVTKSPKFTIDESNKENPNNLRQVLMEFTKHSREEIIPRYLKVIDTFESKSDMLQVMLSSAQKDLGRLLVQRVELQESTERLDARKREAQKKHIELTGRMKEVSHKLQDYCRNKTLAELKMGKDLVDFKKRAEDLRVGLIDAKTKYNYYNTQVDSQTKAVSKHVKPLHLDTDRTIFLKTNLNIMRQNIEELIIRTKKIKDQAQALTGSEYSGSLTNISHSSRTDV